MTPAELIALAAAKGQANQEASKSATVAVTITGIVEWKKEKTMDDGSTKPYIQLQVFTKEMGTQWCMDWAVKNRPSNSVYGDGIKAQMVITPTKYTDKNGVEQEGHNVNSIILETMSVEKASMLDALIKAGHSLSLFS